MYKKIYNQGFNMRKITLNAFLALFMLFSNPFQIWGNDVTKFEKWLVKTTRHLDENGKIIYTALGDVQVVINGKGPEVLALHGGFGGWDQGELVASNIANHGFKVISVSRPGYLSTPIFTNPLIFQETNAAQQADLMAALLDALNIPKALVVGFSA